MTIKNEETQKNIYSLSDLVEEIYDIKSDSESFPSNYKDLLRIDKALRGVSDYNVSQGILEENKKKYIQLIKNIIRNPDIKKIVKRIEQNKHLTDEEYNKYTQFMLENLSDDKVGLKVKELGEIRKRIKSIEYKVRYILNIIPRYFDEESIDLMEIVLDKYEQGINKLHDEIKELCEELDSIDDERYKQKLIRTFSQYTEKNLNIENNIFKKSKDKKS